MKKRKREKREGKEGKRDGQQKQQKAVWLMRSEESRRRRRRCCHGLVSTTGAVQHQLFLYKKQKRGDSKRKWLSLFVDSIAIQEVVVLLFTDPKHCQRYKNAIYSDCLWSILLMTK